MKKIISAVIAATVIIAYMFGLIDVKAVGQFLGAFAEGFIGIFQNIFKAILK